MLQIYNIFSIFAPKLVNYQYNNEKNSIFSNFLVPQYGKVRDKVRVLFS